MAKKTEQRRPGARVHIIARGNRWAIKKEGLSKATKIYQRIEDALYDARRLKENGHDVIVHNKDGSIQRWEKSS